LNGFLSPEPITADFTYVRLHGPGAAYQGNYPKQTLRQWARKIASWSERLRDIYVYFDNDQAAYAAKNALELKRMVVRSARESEAA
jgi:uncharacterized protein YecE (DUF72 family)